MANNDVVELKITYKSCNQNSYNNNEERQQHEKLKLLLAGTEMERVRERERERESQKRGQEANGLAEWVNVLSKCVIYCALHNFMITGLVRLG